MEGNNKELHSAIMASYPLVLAPLPDPSPVVRSLSLAHTAFLPPCTPPRTHSATMAPSRQVEDDGSALQAFLRKAHQAKARGLLLCLNPRAPLRRLNPSTTASQPLCSPQTR